MKFNWRILVALVLVGGGIYLAMEATRLSSYTGKNLSFAVGSGPVTMTNPSNESIPVRLVSAEMRSFSVSSPSSGVSGASTRSGSGRSTTYFFEFELPPGVSVFTVVHGTNVNFVATTETTLKAAVQPLSEYDAQTIMLAAAVVVLGALFYISHTTGHRWIGILRRQELPFQG